MLFFAHLWLSYQKIKPFMISEDARQQEMIFCGLHSYKLFLEGNLALFIKSLKNLYTLFDLVIPSFLKDYLICGCTGLSWRCAVFSPVVVSGAYSPVPELERASAVGACGLQSAAQQLWCTGFAAWWCLRSPQSGDGTHVPCIGRYFLATGLPGKP